MSKPTSVRPIPIGNYNLHQHRLLGSGGFGWVWEGYHTILGVPIAMKAIEHTNIRTTRTFIKCIRESEILSRLQHQNIVRFFEVIDKPNVYIITMELAEGDTLKRYISRYHGGKLNESKSRLIVRQLSMALRYMHMNNITHRDLKLDNIVISARTMNIKIIDFGFSNTVDPIKKLNSHCGTAFYAAPEILDENENYGVEVDMWSLGIIIFVMVTGHLPFYSPSWKFRQLQLVLKKGLTSKQMKRLWPMTYDFKDMLVSLLKVNPVLRLTAEELTHHRWVRNNQQFDPNKIDLLNPEEIRKVALNIGTITSQSVHSVAKDLRENPRGSTAGMNNILKHMMITTGYSPNDDELVKMCQLYGKSRDNRRLFSDEDETRHIKNLIQSIKSKTSRNSLTVERSTQGKPSSKKQKTAGK